MDLIMQRTTTWRPVARALVVGLAFFVAFVAVQWPFANFMMTPAARNWFFGSGYLDFATPPRSPLARYEFFYRDADGWMFWRGMALAGIVAWFMAWIGMHAGRAMQKVRR
jgi:hypothetical protein